MFAKAREKARQTACLNNQRQIATACLMYAQDNNELLPTGATVWGSLNMDKGVLICPTLGTKYSNGYGYDMQCDGVALGEITDTSGTVLTADAVTTANNLLYSPANVDYRHGSKTIMTCVDGHAEITTLALVCPPLTNDLTSGLPTGTLVDGTNGWTRTGYYRNGYAYTNYDDGAGFPGGDKGGGGNSHQCNVNTSYGQPAPCLYLAANSDGQSNESCSHTISVPTGSTAWAVSMDAELMDIAGQNDRSQIYITLNDSTAKTVVYFYLYDWNNTGYGVNFNNKVIYSSGVAHGIYPNMGGWRHLTFVGYGSQVCLAVNGTLFTGSVYTAGANVMDPVQTLKFLDVTGYGNIRIGFDNVKYGAK